MSGFDLREHAFTILATTPRAKRAELEDAYHNACLDAEGHENEARLHRAQKALLSPRDRLNSELSFFTDTKPATIRKIVAGLQSANPPAVPTDLAGLDRANLLAHLSIVGTPSARRSHALELVETYASVSPEMVLEAINSLRAISGFGSVDQVSLKAALNKVSQGHAKTALRAFMAGETGPEDVRRFAEALSTAGPTGNLFIESILREYEADISPQLEAGAEQVRLCLAAVAERPDDLALLDEVRAALLSWDRLAQPLQNADQARGIDEQHSRELSNEVRRSCLTLANDNGLYRQALAVTRIAQEVFAELPDAAAKLAEDATKLCELVEDAEATETLAPLMHALDAAQAHHSTTCYALRRFGFHADADSPIGEVQAAFIEVLNAKNQKLSGDAARAVRVLCLDLCNESNDSSAALTMVLGLLAHHVALPPDVVQALENDRATLQRNVDFSSLNKAVREGRLDAADQLAERMLDGADQDTLGMLVNIREIIAQRKSSRRNKLIGWGIFAAFVLFVILSDSSKPDSTPYSAPISSDTDYSASGTYSDDVGTTEQVPVENTLEPAAEVAAAPDEPESTDATVADTGEESQPPTFGVIGAASVGEIRYCQKQKVRIEAARAAGASNDQIDRFNRIVDDYNVRCSSFKYMQPDMDTVESEIVTERLELERQGRDLIGVTP